MENDLGSKQKRKLYYVPRIRDIILIKEHGDEDIKIDCAFGEK